MKYLFYPCWLLVWCASPVKAYVLQNNIKFYYICCPKKKILLYKKTLNPTRSLAKTSNILSLLLTYVVNLKMSLLSGQHLMHPQIQILSRSRYIVTVLKTNNRCGSKTYMRLYVHQLKRQLCLFMYKYLV